MCKKLIYFVLSLLKPSLHLAEADISTSNRNLHSKPHFLSGFRNQRTGGSSYRVLHNVGLVRQPGRVLHLKHHPVTTSVIWSHVTVVGIVTLLKWLKNGVVWFKRVLQHSNLVCWNGRDVWRHGCLSNHPVGNTVGWWEKSGHRAQGLCHNIQQIKHQKQDCKLRPIWPSLPILNSSSAGVIGECHSSLKPKQKTDLEWMWNTSELPQTGLSYKEHLQCNDSTKQREQKQVWHLIFVRTPRQQLQILESCGCAQLGVI